MDENVLGRFAQAGYIMQRNRVKGTESFVESFRPNQIKSKKIIVDELLNHKMSWNKVLVLGSWNGILLYELFKKYGDVMWFDFLDKDPIVHKHRDIYFENNSLEKNYNSLVMDAVDFSDYENYDLIINTSCEHMPTIPAIYGPTYALQSNNYTAVPEHINCVNTADQLAKDNKINKIWTKSQKKFSNYTRFTVVGYRY